MSLGGAVRTSRLATVSCCHYPQGTRAEKHQRARLGYWLRLRENVLELEVSALELDRTVRARELPLGRESDESCSCRSTADEGRREDRLVLWPRVGGFEGCHEAAERKRRVTVCRP
jgi:hypothetical protein